MMLSVARTRHMSLPRVQNHVSCTPLFSIKAYRPSHWRTVEPAGGHGDADAVDAHTGGDAAEACHHRRENIPQEDLRTSSREEVNGVLKRGQPFLQVQAYPRFMMHVAHIVLLYNHRQHRGYRSRRTRYRRRR